MAREDEETREVATDERPIPPFVKGVLLEQLNTQRKLTLDQRRRIERLFKENKWVTALGALDMVREMIEYSVRRNTLEELERLVWRAARSGEM
jgi:hypothetical protein